jgi:hypothetical protein
MKKPSTSLGIRPAVPTMKWVSETIFKLIWFFIFSDLRLFLHKHILNVKWKSEIKQVCLDWTILDVN